jgi:hypothetical protein
MTRRNAWHLAAVILAGTIAAIIGTGISIVLTVGS